MRTLKAGTIIHLEGSKLPLALSGDVEVEGTEGVVLTDEGFVGRLIRNQANFDLNIGSVDGNWNRVTGARMKAECEKCGAEIPFDAEDQETCPNCLSQARIEGAQSEAEERVAPEKRTAAKKAAKKKAAKK